MKLILALLAMLTGLAGGDAVRVAPASPATLGAAAMLVESAAAVAQQVVGSHQILVAAPARPAKTCGQAATRAPDAFLQPGFSPRGMRARE